jgi:L,D-transpeptidase YcbB
VKVLCDLGSELQRRTAVPNQRQRKGRWDHAFGEGILFSSRSFSTRAFPALLGLIAGCAIALVTACAPVPPGGPAGKQMAAAGAVPPADANTEIGKRIGSRAELTVAGEQLNAKLLRRFYARHGFEPIWTTRSAQADSLINAVLHAGDEGLAPELFHANLLQSPSLPSLDRELLLSDAFLSYADALARGVMPVERRRDDEVLTPEPIDVPAALDAAIDSADPAAAVEALAPTTPTYRALREALRNSRAGTSVDDRTPTSELREIELNLERERWLPRPLPADRVWVNVADERLTFYRDNQPVFSTKVIVGQDQRPNQSPEFQVPINAVLFNPPWNVPPDIATNEILPKIASDPDYLAKHHMVMLPDGILQQVAGPNSGLGVLMFLMQNRFDVYLHDTPSKNLFLRDDRRISHGCIRVENPRELAALLLQQPIDAIDQAIATGSTTTTDLPKPVPVFVVYETAFADTDGRLQFRPDIYGRDDEIWAQLGSERTPVAARETPRQHGG